MTKNIFSRAAHRADQFIFAIADKLNGNATRRILLRRRLYAVMLTQRIAALLQLSVNGGRP